MTAPRRYCSIDELNGGLPCGFKNLSKKTGGIFWVFAFRSCGSDLLSLRGERRQSRAQGERGKCPPFPLRIPFSSLTSVTVGALPVMRIYGASIACRCRCCGGRVSVADPREASLIRHRLHPDTLPWGIQRGPAGPLGRAKGERSRRGENLLEKVFPSPGVLLLTFPTREK